MLSVACDSVNAAVPLWRARRVPQSDDPLLLIGEERGEGQRAYDIGAQLDDLHDGHSRIVVDEGAHGDEDAKEHAQAETKEVDEEECGDDDKVLNRVNLRARAGREWVKWVGGKKVGGRARWMGGQACAWRARAEHVGR